MVLMRNCLQMQMLVSLPFEISISSVSYSDVVYIGVVHQKHKDLVLQAVDAGKSILCEKPIGVHAREAQELYSYAKSKGVFLMEATWSRFFPVYQHIRKVLDANELGDVKGVSANFGTTGLVSFDFN